MSAAFGYYSTVLNREGGGRAVTLEQLVAIVRDGQLSRPTAHLRCLAGAERDAAKRRLPAFSCVVQPRRRGIEQPVAGHSGFVALDYDHLDADAAMLELAAHPSVAFAYRTPSGEGVRAVVPVAPAPGPSPAESDDDLQALHWNHGCAWAAARDAIGPLAGVDADDLRDFTRLSFLCHDADAVHRPDARPVSWAASEPPVAAAAPAAPPVRADGGFLADADRYAGEMGRTAQGRHAVAERAAQRLHRYVAEGRVGEPAYEDAMRRVCAASSRSMDAGEVARLIKSGRVGRVGGTPLPSRPLARRQRPLRRFTGELAETPPPPPSFGSLLPAPPSSPPRAGLEGEEGEEGGEGRWLDHIPDGLPLLARCADCGGRASGCYERPDGAIERVCRGCAPDGGAS